MAKSKLTAEQIEALSLERWNLRAKRDEIASKFDARIDEIDELLRPVFLAKSDNGEKELDERWNIIGRAFLDTALLKKTGTPEDKAAYEEAMQQKKLVDNTLKKLMFTYYKVSTYLTPKMFGKK